MRVWWSSADYDMPSVSAVVLGTAVSRSAHWSYMARVTVVNLSAADQVDYAEKNLYLHLI